MRICAFIQMYNEVIKGNLVRCLENVRQWADDIVIYDDCSTDNSVKVASRYTDHIIQGSTNSIYAELSHKQELLELAISLNPDWIMWIDCDEILDRRATTGGLRELAGSSEGIAHSFHEVNLWRSQTYARIDSWFDKGWFCRLWRVLPGLRFNVQDGAHKEIWPIGLHCELGRCDLQVIHYGHCEYEKAVVKQGFSCDNDIDFQRIAAKDWIFNETNCVCRKLSPEVFPVENVPEDAWPQPIKLPLNKLRAVSNKGLEVYEQYTNVFDSNNNIR